MSASVIASETSHCPSRAAQAASSAAIAPSIWVWLRASSASERLSSAWNRRSSTIATPRSAAPLARPISRMASRRAAPAAGSSASPSVSCSIQSRMEDDSINTSPSSNTSTGTRPSGEYSRMRSKSAPTDQARCSNAMPRSASAMATRRVNGESSRPIRIMRFPPWSSAPGSRASRAARGRPARRPAPAFARAGCSAGARSR